jgi:hypothetical protein
MNPQQDVFFLGVDAADPTVHVPILESRRGVHHYVLGSSSVGKSKLLMDWILQSALAGHGCAVIDPKGDLIFDLLAALASLDEGWWPALAERVVLIDPSDPATSATFNPLAVRDGTTPARQRADLFQTFQKIWGINDAQTPRMDLVLRRTLQLLMDSGLTLTAMPRVLGDAAYRDLLVQNTADPDLRNFWLYQLPSSEAQRFQWLTSILTRIEGFLDDPSLRTMFGSARGDIDFRAAMDRGQLILVNLSSGRLGQQSAQLLGGFVATKLQLAAESRQNIWPPESRRRFYIACDEFHGYMVSSGLRDLLSEGRGYGVSLILAHQSLGQLDAPLRESILANAKIRACFRVSHDDSEVLAKEIFTAHGDVVKSRALRFLTINRVPIPIGFDNTYLSHAEEMRRYRESLHRLPDRHFWAHLADTNTAMRLRTIDIPPFDRRISEERIACFKALVASRRPVPTRGAARRPITLRQAPAPPRPRLFEWTPPGVRRPPGSRSP